MEATLLATKGESYVYSFYEGDESFIQVFCGSQRMIENQVKELCKNLSFKKYKDILEFEEKLSLHNK